MPGTYSQLLLHVVFSTKGRTPWITPMVSERLYPYIGGINRSERGVLYDIGGVEDHVHLYLRWRPDGSVSDLMRTVKARSSKWIHEEFPDLGACAWQEVQRIYRQQVAGGSGQGVHRQSTRASQDRQRTSSPNFCGCSGCMRSSLTSGMCLTDLTRGRSLPLPLRGSGEIRPTSTGCARRLAPPVATTLRPVGAKSHEIFHASTAPGNSTVIVVPCCHTDSTPIVPPRRFTAL